MFTPCRLPDDVNGVGLAPAAVDGACDEMVTIQVQSDVGYRGQQLDARSGQAFVMLEKFGELGFIQANKSVYPARS